MNKAEKSARLKGLGYLTSSVSVLLLGVAAWEGASSHPLLLIALVTGMVASIAGMLLRWNAFQAGQEDKRQIKQEVREQTQAAGVEGRS